MFIRTCSFRQTPQYSRSLVVSLRRPASDTAATTNSAIRGLGANFKLDSAYAKAGVILLDIGSSDKEQFELDLEASDCISASPPAPEARPRLMAALDLVNERYGRGTLKLASAGSGAAGRNWTMKQELRTRAYTMR